MRTKELTLRHYVTTRCPRTGQVTFTFDGSQSVTLLARGLNGRLYGATIDLDEIPEESSYSSESSFSSESSGSTGGE